MRHAAQAGIRRAPVCTGAPGSLPAFSLVELLVVVVVAGVLAALALPTLAKSMHQARVLKSLSLHRQAVAVLRLYSDDHREAFPYLQTPGDPHGPKRLPGFELRDDVGYFTAAAVYWPNLLRGVHVEHGAAREWGLPDSEDSNIADGYPPDTIRARLFLTNTASADPAFWITDEQPEDLSLLRSTAQFQVVFPAEKGLLVDIRAGLYDPRRAHLAHPGFDASVGWCDGSGRILHWSPEDPTRAVERWFGAKWWQVMATRGGLGGRDF